jgi:hypothetical protein
LYKIAAGNRGFEFGGRAEPDHFAVIDDGDLMASRLSSML